jgi:hypothetical protein
MLMRDFLLMPVIYWDVGTEHVPHTKVENEKGRRSAYRLTETCGLLFRGSGTWPHVNHDFSKGAYMMEISDVLLLVLRFLRVCRIHVYTESLKGTDCGAA